MIPVPPFADVHEARLFLRQLSIHVASLDRDRVTLPTFVLLSVLARTHESLRRVPVDASPVRVPAIVLEIAVLSRFPAPWTPQGLHTARAAGDAWATTPPTTATVFSDGSDPIIQATLTPRGTWTITHSERGTTRVLHEDLDDDAYVQVLIREARGHPFPYGWRSHDLLGFAEVVGGAVTAREEWESGPGQLPYLKNWIAERDARGEVEGAS